MKLQWESYHKRFGEAVELVQELIDGITDKRTLKAAKKFSHQFNGTVVSHNEINKLMKPVPEMAVKMPFDSKEFAEAWQLFMEYLEEQYRIFWYSRMQAINLNRLSSFCLKDEARAIRSIHCHIAFGYKKIYPLTDEQIDGKDTNVPEDNIPTNTPSLSSKRIDL